MAKHLKQQSKKIGMRPGSYIFVGEKKVETVEINLMDYDLRNYEFRDIEKLEEVFPYQRKKSITWVNIYGLHETGMLQQIEKQFGIHPLVMEDILNTAQHPKIEVYEQYVFVVLKMIRYVRETSELMIEQIGIIALDNFILCFQERRGDIFNPLRKRIQEGKGRARKSGVDYLLYAMMDVIVDHYFVVLEELGDQIEILDEEILTDPDHKQAQRINHLKRELMFLRKSIWPLREVVNSITREESDIFQETTLPFLRDLYDHIIQIIDTIETHRDMVSGIMDLYMTSISNRMNEVMKVLTIIATIFIPLTFIAGIYGMNFETMPELHLGWGYPAVWMVMIIVAIVMVVFFRKRHWL